MFKILNGKAVYAGADETRLVPLTLLEKLISETGLVKQLKESEGKYSLNGRSVGIQIERHGEDYEFSIQGCRGEKTVARFKLGKNLEFVPYEEGEIVQTDLPEDANYLRIKDLAEGYVRAHSVPREVFSTMLDAYFEGRKIADSN